MGTANPSGKDQSIPEPVGHQEEGDTSGWQSWERYPAPEDVPQGRDGQPGHSDPWSKYPAGQAEAGPRSAE
eukprot:4551013-Heterocapsa_arctica.AAC.1